MKRIQVDFNEMLYGGTQVWGIQEHASEPLSVGDVVEAFDPYDEPEELRFPGEVVEIDARGVVYVKLDRNDDLAEIDTTDKQFAEYMARAEPVRLIDCPVKPAI